ncbi:MAG: hypothetical protein GYB31_05120 [Bacteroidetes bacterium]|nr:hypothetical protein [Bacteroidota bacterium]
MFRVKNLLFTLGLFMISCAGNPDEADEVLTEDMLFGRWELESATRDGQPTETLNTTFFEFISKEKMATNLGTGAREEVDYNLTESTIQQLSGRFQTEYTILNFSDSTLVLSMELREIPFELNLKRSSQEDQMN